MKRYHFTLKCAPEPRTRRGEIQAFFAQTSEVFRVSRWLDENDNRITPDPQSLDRALPVLMAAAEGRPAEMCVVKSLETPPILLSISLGGRWSTPNFFGVDFSRRSEVPPIEYFTGLVTVIRPFEASVADVDNVSALIDERPSRADTRVPPPKGLYWLHYLNADLVKNVGGFEHALRTPCFRVSRFCDGLLFQLTEEPLDHTNERHREIQRRAMEHLGI